MQQGHVEAKPQPGICSMPPLVRVKFWALRRTKLLLCLQKLQENKNQTNKTNPTDPFGGLKTSLQHTTSQRLSCWYLSLSVHVRHRWAGSPNSENRWPVQQHRRKEGQNHCTSDPSSLRLPAHSACKEGSRPCPSHSQSCFAPVLCCSSEGSPPSAPPGNEERGWLISLRWKFGYLSSSPTQH